MCPSIACHPADLPLLKVETLLMGECHSDITSIKRAG